MRTLARAILFGLVISALLGLPTPGVAQISTEEFSGRRAALAERVGDGLILALGSAAHPQDYISFFQNALFRYLTGFTEPDAALVMVVEGGTVRETLFVNPRDPAYETWEGVRMGPERSREFTGIPGRSALELQNVMDSLLTHHSRVRLVGAYQPGAVLRNDITQRADALLEGHPDVALEPINGEVSALRAVKSTAELDLIRRANTLTVAAHREVAGALAPGRNEFEIQAIIEYTFRRYGAERPAFASIVGSGPNSTILHYNANDRFMERGEVVVVDIGASYAGYAADITRTYPVDGRFTPAQLEIYQLVRDAQAGAEAVAGPGVSLLQVGTAAADVLREGLARLGLMESPHATFEGADGRSISQLQLYYMHGIGHGIGLNVHDPAPTPLRPGAFISIEPGLYVRPNLLGEVIPDTPANRTMMTAIRPAFERYVGIGVRIEDNYIVTDDGVEWISRAPREIFEVEGLMARPMGGTERNAEWVEWFRRMR